MASEEISKKPSKQRLEARRRQRPDPEAPRGRGPEAPAKGRPSNIPGDPRKALSAANDDEPFAAALIEGLRRQPTGGPLYAAMLLSILWVIAGVIFAMGYFGPRIAENGAISTLLGEPEGLVFAVLAFLPIPMFWTIAYMIRRSKELRLMAQAMLQTSLRLAQPETFTRESVTSLGQAIRGEVAAMSEGVERALARAGELEMLVKNEVVALERSYSENEDRMRRLVDTIKEERTVMSSLTENVATEMEPTLLRLREETASLHKLIDGSARGLLSIEERMAERTDAITKALDNMDATSVTLAEVANTVADRAAGSSEMMGNNIEVLRDTADKVLNDVEAISVQFSQQTDGLFQASESLQSANMQVDAALKKRHDSLAEVALELDGKIADVDKTMDTFSDLLRDTFAGAQANATEIADQITETAQSATKLAMVEFERVAQAADNKAKEIGETLTSATTEAAEAAAVELDRASQLAETLTSVAAENTTVITENLRQLVDEAHTQVAQVTEELASSSQEAAKGASARFETAMKEVETKAIEVTDLFAQAADKSTDAATRRLDDAMSAAATKSQQVSEAIAKASEETARIAAGELDKAMKTTIDKANEVTGAVTKVTSDASRSIETGFDQLMKTALDRANQAAEVVGKAAAESSNLVARELDRVMQSSISSSREVADIIGRASNESVAHTSTELDKVMQSTLAKANDVANVLTKTSQETSRVVIGEMETAMQSAVGKANEVATIIGRAAHETSTAASAELDQAMKVALGKANEINAIMSKASQVASSTATDGLDRAIREAEAKAQQVALMLTHSAENASKTAFTALEQTVKLAEQKVNEVTGSFARASSESSQAAAVNLERLASQATKRLNEAQSAAQFVGEAVQKNAGEATAKVIDELQKLHDATSRELTGMANAYRSTYKEAAQDINQNIEGAAKQFSTSANQMAGIAREMAQELQRTRASLKQSVMDLPEETRQNTAAMRKVVADQIAALTDLSELVARHTAPFEASAPAQNRPQAAPTARATTKGKQARSPRGANTPAKAAGGQGGKWALPELLAAASQPGEPGPAQPAASRARARAPRDDRSPLHVVESLNSISMDIARALDHQAPAELWARYKRGERNVFTRRLYTMRGQQLFDEISEKYQRDSEFSADVDRYVADFEQLVEAVSDDDRDNMLVDTYLTSETGKVYLMLAHAAGRLT